MQCDLEQPGALARLLRELPDDSAQPYSFREFERRAEQRTSARRSRSGGEALAALAVIALGVVVLSMRLDGPVQPAPRPEESAAQPVGAWATTIGAGEQPGVSAARAELLERWLASLPQEPALARVGARAAVAGLEDRLAEVDDLLTAERIDEAQPARLFALQQERRRLVSSLAQVRYAETLAAESR